MSLPFREKLTMLVPPAWFYRRRIRYELRTGEPELAILAELMPRGGTAVDVGANQGFFAYALAAVADRVVAFEPNPDYAAFARWMLRGRAEVHEIALSDKPGRAHLLCAGLGRRHGAPPRRQPEEDPRQFRNMQHL